ncbi:hypothetical protein KEM54_003438, partial [Ascosphaera aggregata]
TGRRASEVYDEQKRRNQEIQEDAESPLSSLRFHTVLFWVHSASEVLKKRLDNRVDSMENRGLVTEAEVLFNYLQEKRQQGIHVDRTRGVWVSIGFKEFEPYFEAVRAGKHDEAEMQKLKESCLDAVKTSTRRYAKQQIKWIRGKLWNSLTAAGAEDKLFVVDTTDPSNWNQDVFAPAKKITSAFLSMESLPNPMEVSACARKILTPLWEKKASSRIGAPLHNITCDVCKVTVLSGLQWQSHAESARHRRCVKLAEKRAEMFRNNPHYRAAKEARARSSTPLNEGIRQDVTMASLFHFEYLNGCRPFSLSNPPDTVSLYSLLKPGEKRGREVDADVPIPDIVALSFYECWDLVCRDLFNASQNTALITKADNDLRHTE